jgi:hypothetical protein
LPKGLGVIGGVIMSLSSSILSKLPGVVGEPETLAVIGGIIFCPGPAEVPEAID